MSWLQLASGIYYTRMFQAVDAKWCEGLPDVHTDGARDTVRLFCRGSYRPDERQSVQQEHLGTG